MIVAKVMDSIVSTRKHQSLQGIKLLLVQPLCGKDMLIAGDLLGAGVGEIVLITQGGPAREALEKPAPVDAMVVGILDRPLTIDGQEG